MEISEGIVPVLYMMDLLPPKKIKHYSGIKGSKFSSKAGMLFVAAR